MPKHRFAPSPATKPRPKGEVETLDALRERLSSATGPVFARALAQLKRDARPGAQKLYAILKRRLERERDERMRIGTMLHFERLLWQSGLSDVAGVDEVGVGPLAGPVVAAAVVFPPGTEIPGVDDSKRLDPERRAELAELIRTQASGIGIGACDVDEIERLNIYHAALQAMKRAVEALPRRPQHLLVDARTIPGLGIPQNPFTRGDGLNFSIAAASIVAKTHRDRLMTELDKTFPEYGFASHKGYDTPEHRAALERLGPCAVHRMSFAAIGEICGGCSALFYELREGLNAARQRSALEAFERDLQSRLPALSESEARKLKLLTARRWRTLESVHPTQNAGVRRRRRTAGERLK
jgi:ribonuclease HII